MAGKLGIAHQEDNRYTYRYELTDHLGSVRAVISREGSGQRQVDYYADIPTAGSCQSARRVLIGLVFRGSLRRRTRRRGGMLLS